MSPWPEVDRDLQQPLRALRDRTAALDTAANWPSSSLEVLGDADVLGWVIPR